MFLYKKLIWLKNYGVKLILVSSRTHPKHHFLVAQAILFRSPADLSRSHCCFGVKTGR